MNNVTAGIGEDLVAIADDLSLQVVGVYAYRKITHFFLFSFFIYKILCIFAPEFIMNDLKR